MAELNPQQWQAIEAQIFAGHKIEAIKLYREAIPGTGLKDAKEAVEKMEADLRRLSPEKFSAGAQKSGCTSLLAVGVLVGLAVWAYLT